MAHDSELVDVDMLDAAATAAREAYKTKAEGIGDAGAAGDVWVAIPINPQHRPLIRDLDDIGMGRFDAYRCEWRIGPSDFLHRTDDRVQSMEVQDAGCTAFAAYLRARGFDPNINSMVD